MYKTSIEHIPPTPQNPHAVPFSPLGNALMVVIGAALGIYLYYKRIQWTNSN